MSASEACGHGGEEHVARLVAALLSREPVSELAQRCHMTVEAFVAFRSAFVAHGLSAFLDVPRHRWHQLNVRLRDDGNAYRRLARGSLLPSIESWLAERRLTDFFFMNKPPGLRLRLRTADHASPPDIDAFARRLLEEGAADVRRAIYEPETALFGGQVGIDLAHRFFTLDSLRTLAHFRALAQDAETRSSVAVSVPWICRLLDSALGDRSEAWDVLRRVHGFGRQGGEVRPEILALVPARDAAPAPDETEAFGDLARVGETLRVAREVGDLPVGLRQVLPFWLIFHWNRIGFGRRQQADLVATLAALHDPHG